MNRAVYIVCAIAAIAFLMWFAMMDARAAPQGLPKLAYTYAPVLLEEQERFWPDHPHPGWLGAQVEQESCISLKHSRCWNPEVEFKPKSGREYGFGLSQFTVAYKNGKERFNAWQEARDQFRRELEGWTWDNRFDALYQLRAMVLKMQYDAGRFESAASPSDQHAMAQAAYNGGLASVIRDRSLCAGLSGCDPDKWWGNVEVHSRKSRKALYGGRSAFDINREYPRNIQKVRYKRYKWMG